MIYLPTRRFRYLYHPCFFVTTDKLAYANFCRCVPFFCQAAGDLYEALPQSAVKQNSLLYIIWVDHLQLPRAHSWAADNKQREGKTQANNTRRARTEANHTRNKRWSTSLAPLLVTTKAWNFSQFTAYSCYGVQVNVRIRARAFGVKRTGVLQVNVQACERV